MNVENKNTKKNSQIGLIIISILLFWHFTLMLNLPYVPTDGPWTLSKLFSFLNGEFSYSRFAHNYMGDFFKVHVFEILHSPFFLIAPTNTYSFILYNYLQIITTIGLLYYLFAIKKRNSLLFILTATSVLTSTYTFGMRSENYCTPLLLSMLILMTEEKIQSTSIKSICVVFILAVTSLCHPAAAISGSLIVLYWFISKKSNPKICIQLTIAGVIFLLILSTGNLQNYILNYLSSNELENHDFSFTLLPKFLTLSLGIFVIIPFAIKFKTKFNLVIILFFCAILMFFGRSYYFYYLFPFLFTIIFLSTPNNVSLPTFFSKQRLFIIMAFFLTALIFSHINSTIIQVENNTYGNQFRKILTETRKIHNKLPKNTLIWVPSQLGMEVIEHKNARLHFPFYASMSGNKIRLKNDDVLLFFNAKEMKQLNQHVLGNNFDELKITQIIPPVKGLLRIGTLYKQRTDSLGLWQVSLKRND